MSSVAADNKVFLASAEGKVTVLKAGGQWEVLGVNDLGDEIHATPALSGGESICGLAAASTASAPRDRIKVRRKFALPY